jgi:hypothetical protein
MKNPANFWQTQKKTCPTAEPGSEITQEQVNSSLTTSAARRLTESTQRGGADIHPQRVPDQKVFIRHCEGHRDREHCVHIRGEPSSHGKTSPSKERQPPL